MKTKMTPSEFIAFRNKYKKSHAELAELFGVSVQAVAMWENGQRGISETLRKLVVLFDKQPNLMKEF